MKNFFYLFFLLGFLFVTYFCWNVWQNNREVVPSSHAEIKEHFDRSVDWLNTNYSGIKNNHNPTLWWMIKLAGLNSNNETLKNIFSKYKVEYLDMVPPNLSTPMFDKLYRPNVPDIALLSHLQDYQKFFVYGRTCNADLSSEPIILQQMRPGFCSFHFLHSRCITHQIMGLRYMQRFQCGHVDTINTTIDALHKVVISELTWDFRVGDAYIQRVLMLVDSGAYDQVKPVWISNILEAQNVDGSWDDLHPVLYLDDGYVLAYTSKLPKIRKPIADFHATAQVIWLLSLLLQQ